MRVLLVEDEPDLQRVIWTCLQEEGYVVDTAGDGEEGLYKATNWDYDAVVLDVMLPKLDGWQVLTRFRKVKSTPVLLLTARDSLQDRVKGLDSGADDYVVKPFQLEELLARLRALIRRAAGQSTPSIEVGDTNIDTVSRTVTRGGAMIPLTAMEYSLVELLALHKGKLVTRSMIYDKLYDEDDDTLSNLVDVHVSNIRRKLGHEFIMTRRGQGYMIND